MKAMFKVQIGDYSIIQNIADAAVDAVRTQKGIKSLLKPEMTKEDRERLYMENLVYANVGPETELIDDNMAKELQQKLDTKEEHSLLLSNGDYLPNFYDVEYWNKKNGKWVKSKIDEIGIAPPKAAVLLDKLSREQQEEINAQQEEERIANLTPEKKEEEKDARLHALAREALNKAEEAELLGQVFDKKAWVSSKIQNVERMYA